MHSPHNNNAATAPKNEICPACAGQLRVWRSAPSGEPSIAGKFELWRCVACRTAVTAGDAPTFGEAHDAGSYATRRPRGSSLAAPILRLFDRQRLHFLGPRQTLQLDASSAPRLLDVGAGRGRFVATAEQGGWQASGIEPSNRGVEAALSVYGVSLQQALIGDAEVEPQSVDAITLWHVLEHLDDPAKAVAQIAQWLRPGGTLLVGVPNLNSLQAWIGGSRWFHLDVPRHRVHMTPQGLSALLEGCGLEVTSNKQLLLEHNPFGMWQSLVNRLSGRSSYLFHLLKRAEPLEVLPLAISLLCLPLLPLAVVAEALAGAAGRGGTMAVTARRLPALQEPEFKADLLPEKAKGPLPRAPLILSLVLLWTSRH